MQALILSKFNNTNNLLTPEDRIKNMVLNLKAATSQPIKIIWAYYALDEEFDTALIVEANDVKVILDAKRYIEIVMSQKCSVRRVFLV